MAVLLDVGRAVEFSRQRSDLSHFYRDGVRPGRRARGRFEWIAEFRTGRKVARRGFMRLGIHGSEHLHRKRSELHGEEHCGTFRNQNAVVRRLYGVLGSDPGSTVRCHDIGILPELRELKDRLFFTFHFRGIFRHQS